jgi:hypothetical protein
MDPFSFTLEYFVMFIELCKKINFIPSVPYHWNSAVNIIIIFELYCFTQNKKKYLKLHALPGS